MLSIVYNLAMEDIHPLFESIRRKILDLIDQKNREGLSLEKIGELCGLTKTHISTLRSGKRGANFSLNAALKIWTGLGHPPETLIADCNIEPILAKKIKQIQQGEYARLLALLVNILCDLEYVDDLRELAKVEGYLEAIWDRIVKLKDQQPAAPGEKLSNSGGI